MKTLVMLDWLDAETSSGWTAESDAQKAEPARCQTVGWLIYSDDERVVVAMTIAGEEVNGVIVIPGKWIERMTTVIEPSNVVPI